MQNRRLKELQMQSKTIRIATCLLSLVSTFFTVLVQADSAFEGTKDTVTRTGFSFFGGQLESMEIGQNGTVYAGFNAPSSVFCSTDGGATWSSPAAGTDLGSTHSLTINPTTGAVYLIGGIKAFRSTDTCQTWTQLTGSGSFTDYGFAIAYGNSTLLIGNRDGTVDRSTNPADTTPSFTKVTIVSGGSDVAALTFSAADGEFLALVTNSGTNTLYKSSGQGSSWTSLNKSGNYRGVGVDPTNANRIVISGNNGDEFSIDGGSNWSSVNGAGGGGHAARFVDVLVGGQTERRAYINGSWTTDLNTFSTFHPSNEPTSDSALSGLFASDPTNRARVFAQSELGVATSTDGALTFHDTVNGIRAVQINRIAQAADKNLVYIATSQGLARTTNFLATAGPTWAFPFSAASFDLAQFFSVLIDKNDSNIVYAGGVEGDIYRTSNGGTSWTKVFDGTQPQDLDALDLIQTDDGTLYAALGKRQHASGGVLKSTDGTTWTNISSGSFDGYVHALTHVGNVVFAGLGQDQEAGDTTQRGIWKYDQGTWTQVTSIPTNQHIYDIRASGNTLIAAAGGVQSQTSDGAVFRSTDGGTTWTNVTSSGLRTDGGWYRTVAFDPTNANVVYVAHGRPAVGSSEIFRSSDQGLSWSLIYTGLIDEVPSAMLVDDLLTGFQTGLYEFGEQKIKITPVINKGKKLLECTVKKGKTVLKSKQVIALVKVPKAKAFKILKKANTSKKGIASFSLKKVKVKSKLYCTAVGQKSSTKMLQ